MKNDPIPVLDLTAEIDSLWDEINAALQAVLRSGQFIMGAEVKAFEAEAAAYLGVKHAIGLNSGTDGLVIGLRALGVQPGDEVITTPFTFFATTEGVEHAGATPVFVDIDPNTFNLDVSQIEAKITPRTKAIIPVHLYGQGADMRAIMDVARRHDLKILEDAAQGFGTQIDGQMLGTIGDAGVYSFFPTKNLGAYGDAGMLVTNDDDVADMARMLRVHGSKKKYHNEINGYNSRLDTMQAAILRVKLPHIDEWNQLRRAAAYRYNELLADVPNIITPTERPNVFHTYHQYTIRIANGRRDDIQAKLKAAGVGTMVYYPVPVHKLPLYADQGISLSCAEQAAAEVLSLPLWPLITAEIQERVVEALAATMPEVS
jgi:dTDP-4-amino-4,6-dideoxygalactose transaminase